jgi:hypothetical protein
MKPKNGNLQNREISVTQPPLIDKKLIAETRHVQTDQVTRIQFVMI